MTERKPEIRFAGYKDNWDMKRFGDVFDILSNNTLSRDNLNDESGAALNVHYGDVLIKFGEYLDVSREKLPYISDEIVVAKFQSSFLKDGDIVIADTAEDETVGKCTEICNIGDKNVLSGLHTIPCRSKEQFAAMFLGYYLNSGKYHDQLLPLMQGIKVTSISKPGMKDTRVLFPKELEEQRNIASLLYFIDKKITAEEMEHERLGIFKIAMLNKMFPRKGMSIPEIRFSGFEDSWEWRPFGEIIARKMSNGIINLPSDKDNAVRHINVINMYTPDKIHVEDLTFSAHGTAEVQKCNVEIGDIFLTRSSVKPEGIAEANILLDSGQYVFDDHLIQMKVKKEYVPMFVKILLGTRPIKMQFIVKAKTTAFTTIGQNDIADSYGMFPSREEQVQISNFFSCLEEAIGLHHSRLVKLKNIKSVCMQKMFV